MGIPLYQAMTSSEFLSADKLPAHVAWMACHFSPYATGISNLPKALPEGSLLILNDRTPIHSHDPKLISQQLRTAIAEFSCAGVLLDFQQQNNSELSALCSDLIDTLPCPVALPEYYTENSAPIFLPPVPLDCSLTSYLASWEGREIWLETALDGCVITLTEQGAIHRPYSPADPPANSFPDAQLHCHCHITEAEKEASFFLYRTQRDLDELLEEAKSFGVTHAVGLYQELSSLR